MIYDIIIIGAGASGLFAASNIKLNKNEKGLILDKSKKPGLKLLMAGSGQCNLTHAGDIKDFVTHYGPNGKKVRSIIYNFSNDMLKDWFHSRGLKLITREDGKVFPESMSSRTVLDLFLKETSRNGFELRLMRQLLLRVRGGSFVATLHGVLGVTTLCEGDVRVTADFARHGFYQVHRGYFCHSC